MTSLAYRKTYDLQDGYSVEFTLDGLSLQCAWSPAVPKGKAARRLHPRYQVARNEFIASLGVPALVVEL